MGLFDLFRKKDYEDLDDEDENEITEEEASEADVSLDGFSQFKICKPKSFEQALCVVDYLVTGKTVLINMEGVEKPLYIRIIDFVSGAAYALGLSINKVTQDSYVIAPKEVDISGEAFATPDGNEEFFTI